jgi:zinc/manganese transport system substrate-binding protein
MGTSSTAGRRTTSVAIGLVLCASLACSPTPATPSSPTDSGRLAIVAAENVYGDIVRQIGGRAVTVTSILSDPNADPHLFDPGTAAALAVAQAQLVIVNGLGYDAFMDRLLEAAPNPLRTVVDVSKSLGVPRSANPHLWYDVPRLPRIAETIAMGLSSAEPSQASSFRSRLAAFLVSLQPLDRVVTALSKRYRGTSVAYTESVPGYLVAAAGLENRAPEAFTRAIEDGIEPSPIAVQEMQHLFTSRTVRLLLYNSQATSPVTERIRQLAVENSIPVVGVTETLPPHQTFQAWQLAQLREIAKALGGVAS